MLKSKFFPFFLAYSMKKRENIKTNQKKDRKKRENLLKKLFTILLQNTILDLVV